MFYSDLQSIHDDVIALRALEWPTSLTIGGQWGLVAGVAV